MLGAARSGGCGDRSDVGTVVRFLGKEIGVNIRNSVAVTISAAAFVLTVLVAAPAASADPAPAPSSGSSNLQCLIQVLIHGEVPGIC